MSELAYTIESTAELQSLVPQQTDFYQSQLRAIGNFAFQGAGANLGAGSESTRYFLNIGGSAPQNVSSLVWRSPADLHSANFAVLPPQEISRRYFGRTTKATEEGNALWVEGIDLHPVGSHYGKLLVSYNETVDQRNRVPLAIGAFIDSMRAHRALPVEERNITSVIGLDPDTHRELGNALLTFWETVTPATNLRTEQTSQRGAYDLASLILRREIELATQGRPDGRHDILSTYVDARGNVSGFIGEDKENGLLSIMVRDSTTYPDTINYLSLATPTPELSDEDIVVSHYAITPAGVGTRICVLSSEEMKHIGPKELVAKIQRRREPLEQVGPASLETIMRGLHAELGALLGSTHLPVENTL